MGILLVRRGPVIIRPIEEADLPYVVEAELAAHSVAANDPDFGELRSVSPAALREKDLLAIIRSRKGAGGDTRTMVLQTKAWRLSDNKRQVKAHWVCGGMAYEALPTSYAILYISIHPDCDTRRCAEGNTRTILAGALEEMKSRARESRTRKLVTYRIPDLPGSQLSRYHGTLLACGFACELEASHSSHDNWLFTFSA
jgi:hypothetical protein